MELKSKKYSLSLSLLFVLIGFFFIPFNSGIYVDSLGEFAREAPIFFFGIGLFFILLKSLFTNRLYLPKNHVLTLLLGVFVLWILIGFVFNYASISQNEIKHTNGLVRFVKQFISLGLSLVFFMVYYNAFKTKPVWELLKWIRFFFLLSLSVVSVYICIETAIIKLNLGFLTQVLYLFDYFPFTDAYLDTNLGRVSGPTFEPPSLATYLITITPWMLSYVATHKGIVKYIPSLLVLIFALLSGSRAGIFIIILQFIVFFLSFVNIKKLQPHLVKILLIGSIGLGVIFILKGKAIGGYVVEKATSFSTKDEDHAVSNKSRLGIQYANFQVFKENPVTGVGLGQQSYHAIHHYPKWATEDNWEFKFKYLNNKHPSFVPGYNLYVRLLAETVIIGFLLFLSILLLSIYICISAIIQRNQYALIYVIILTSLIGASFNWLKMDSLRDYVFWINLALLIYVSSQKLVFKINTKNLPVNDS
ncbi:MAG: O-antigen ligase family protein [Flavobacteriaceae bacterium]|nr:O-antigen ligase family protein [Flavobacteriaceae bacterium]